MSSTLTSTLARTWDENILFSVLVELTYRCNLDCFFCYNDLAKTGRSLSTEQYFELFESLDNLGVLNLVLSGGEPLAHPDFFVLGSRARELGFVVRVKSNGHALGPAMVDRMIDEVDPYVIETSLHGATADTHDQQTRVEGSFERLLANLRGMSERGMRLQVNATLTRWNEHEIEAMFELVGALGLSLNVDPTVTPRDDGDREPLSIAPSAAAVQRLMRLTAAAPAAEERSEAASASTAPKPLKNCGSGSNTLTIDPFGDVFPCVQWRRPVGNLHQQSLEEIWRGSAALEEVREINLQAAEVVAERGLRGFCMGLAEKHTGEPLGEHRLAKDPAAALDAAPGTAALLPIVT